MSLNRMVASWVKWPAFFTFRKARSQMVQMFGFILLRVIPTIRNGSDSGPRIGIGIPI